MKLQIIAPIFLTLFATRHLKYAVPGNDRLYHIVLNLLSEISFTSHFCLMAFTISNKIIAPPVATKRLQRLKPVIPWPPSRFIARPPINPPMIPTKHRLSSTATN